MTPQDDSVLFFRANREECAKIRSIIDTYEKASGQRINLDKSELVASSNVSEEDKIRYKDLLNVRSTDHFEKYLGLPTIIGKSKTQVFKVTVERVLSRIKSWKEQMLTKAGREVLIKTVLQAIPNYAMSCFLFPISLCKDIEKAIARFYWGSTDEHRKHHWVSWDKMSRPKSIGGLGFRELHFFNLAMVAKQYWRILNNPLSLPALLFKAKYFPINDLAFAQIGHSPSYIWRSILSVRDLISKGTAWRVGNGRQIKSAVDNWIGLDDPKPPNGLLSHSDTNSYVSDFIDPDTRSWDIQKLGDNFSPDDVQQILAIPLSPRLPEDRRYWKHTTSGRFTVRSAYHLAVDMLSTVGHELPAASITTTWKKLWGVQTWPKICHFLWLACKDCLPTRRNLVKRGMGEELICRLCNEDTESTEHLFFRCPTVLHVWGRCPVRPMAVDKDGLPFRVVVWELLDSLDQMGASLFTHFLWQIWLARNNFYFAGDEFNHQQIAIRATAGALESENLLRSKPSHTSTPVNRNVSWSPPPLHARKLNCDAAVYRDGTIGMGFVVRDHDGESILAGVKRVRASGSSTLLEGLALRFALRTTVEAGVTIMEIECDNTNLIALLDTDETVDAYEGLVVDDIRSLANYIGCVKFTFIPREANGVAHSIAHTKLDIDDPRVWLDDLPPHLYALLLRDVGREPTT